MTSEKISLHPRNKHRLRYDFPELIKSQPELETYVTVNPYGDQSLDFSDPAAVKALNKSLLKYFYKIDNWDIPENYLCPPIPGRADYIHYLADLLAASNKGAVPTGRSVKGLDIGIGANCVYPIIGHQEYGWSFMGSDVDEVAIKAAKAIILANPGLTNNIICRKQNNKEYIFKGIVNQADLFDFTICNPPFHSSAEEAEAGTKRKLRNLGKSNSRTTTLNFGGKDTELWYKGGEVMFINNMILESREIAKQCFWFTTLVSKSSNLPFVYNLLQKIKPVEIKTIEMAQGQKISRFVAWTFLDPAEQKMWVQKRWH